MPVSTVGPVLQEFPDTSEIEKIRTQLNNLISAFFGLCGHLDADAGVTSTDYTATYGNQASQITTHK